MEKKNTSAEPSWTESICTRRSSFIVVSRNPIRIIQYKQPREKKSRASCHYIIRITRSGRASGYLRIAARETNNYSRSKISAAPWFPRVCITAAHRRLVECGLAYHPCNALRCALESVAISIALTLRCKNCYSCIYRNIAVIRGRSGELSSKCTDGISYDTEQLKKLSISVKK